MDPYMSEHDHTCPHASIHDSYVFINDSYVFINDSYAFICGIIYVHVCTLTKIEVICTYIIICVHTFPYISIHGHMCSLTKIEVIFTCMITYDHIWTHMIIYEPYMAAYGHVWPRMTSYMSINEFIHVHKWMHICCWVVTKACWFLSVLKFLNLYTSRWILQSNNFVKLLISITKRDFISFVAYTTFTLRKVLRLLHDS